MTFNPKAPAVLQHRPAQNRIDLPTQIERTIGMKYIRRNTDFFKSTPLGRAVAEHRFRELPDLKLADRRTSTSDDGKRSKIGVRDEWSEISE